MPQVDTPYVIGVIREKEKGFLEDDEYTRLLQAPTFAEAVRSLTETPYGIYLQQHESVLGALQAHLAAELQWLREVVEDQRFINFLTARYDGLHVAAALMNYQANRAADGSLPWVGSLDAALLTSVIWHGERIEELPTSWRSFIETQRAAISTPSWRASDLLVATKEHVASLMEDLAYTPLMRAVAKLYRHHLTTDISLRTGVVDAVAEQSPVSLPEVPQQAHDEVQQLVSALAYDRWWDEQLMQLIQHYKLEPTGYDAILAYWYAKELEAKTLRVLLSAKMSGVTPATLQALRRPLYYAS